MSLLFIFLYFLKKRRDGAITHGPNGEVANTLNEAKAAFRRAWARTDSNADQLGLVKYQYLSMTGWPGFRGPSQNLSRA